MKYISIDIETTGIDPETDQILSVGAVIEDTKNILPIDKVPSFHYGLRHFKLYGSPFAINMNSDLIDRILHKRECDSFKICNPEELVDKFCAWAVENGIEAYFSATDNHIAFTVAGKNVSTFDLKFLEKLPNWKRRVSTRRRVLDPAILFADWNEDTAAPNLKQCKQRSGVFKDNEVAHDALADAKDVVRLLRTQYEF